MESAHHKQQERIRPKKVAETINTLKQRPVNAATYRTVSSSATSADAETLQQTVGNQATGALLGQSDSAETIQNASSISLDAIRRRIQRLGIQAKLTVGAVDAPQADSFVTEFNTPLIGDSAASPDPGTGSGANTGLSLVGDVGDVISGFAENEGEIEDILDKYGREAKSKTDRMVNL